MSNCIKAEREREKKEQGERERERRKKREIVMDDSRFSIVSYLCGLNALGSWPRSVHVHNIKQHEEKEEEEEEEAPLSF